MNLQLLLGQKTGELWIMVLRRSSHIYPTVHPMIEKADHQVEGQSQNQSSLRFL